MNIEEEKVFQIAEKLADEVFGKEGMEKYSERQVLAVELNKILITELGKLDINIKPNEHDIVVVTKGNDMVSVGDEGTIIHIFEVGKVYEVEFPTKNNLILTMYDNELKKKV